MTEKTSAPNQAPSAGEICFGLNRGTDEKSLAAFIKKFAEPNLMQTIIPRMDDSEISATLDFLSQLMHKHLTKKEYHRLFLKD
ncbi:MAG: hypothetical protein OEY01_09575 [Desulfobulbaceae bacterium]|nr:hypothetical protein [Desulfobulbaceae bacterium]HIJ79253.1 hypothetical protein [Deltaproteobacteria bacterium]